MTPAVPVSSADPKRNPLHAAAEATRDLVEIAPLTEAIAVWEEPWRVAVVGRVSTGKSTLVNLLVGQNARKTGLGGVTREVATEQVGEVEVFDTPGIDDENTALSVLQPLLERVDTVIWVVDGLQPLTASERRVLAASILDDAPLHVLVSRLDLTDEEEAPRVLDRVQTLTAIHAPIAIRRADLRHLDTAPEGLLDRHPSPRRIRAVTAALRGLEEHLDALPEAQNLAQIQTRLRDLWAHSVRTAVEVVEEAIDERILDHKEQAVRALAEGGPTTIAAFEEQLALDLTVAAHLDRHGPPTLPLASAKTRSPIRYVLAGMSGADGAKRALKAAAARWMADGELALIEWLEDAVDLDAEHRHRQRARDAIDCARRHAGG